MATLKCQPPAEDCNFAPLVASAVIDNTYSTDDVCNGHIGGNNYAFSSLHVLHRDSCGAQSADIRGLVAERMHG